MAKQFYFAWVDPGEPFDPDVHNREDEDVFSFTLDHTEGDFAALSLVIRNPRIGLLAPGRKIWAWFSHNRGPDDAPDVIPLFYGRLLGVPSNIFEAAVTVNFTARPPDFVEQKTALAESMKVAPFYDPIFLSPQRWADPDAVLEGYSVMWHIDPVTHVVTTSDVLVPEDGVIDLDEDEIFYESMSLSLQQPPLSVVTIEATIPWNQIYTQDINLRQTVLTSAAAYFENERTGLVMSYTMSGLLGDWPKTGAQVGSGWVCALGELTDVSTSHVKEEPIPDIFKTDDLPVLPEGSIYFPVKASGKYWGGVDGAGYDFQYEIVAVPLGYAVPYLWVRADRQSDYGQVIKFSLQADMQAIATMADEDEALLLTINANRVTDPTEDGSIPIGNVAARDFVGTPRGQQAIEHLICVARANMKIRARAVQISWEMPLPEGLQFTLRKGALIHDDRLPGGEASGKVIGIRHSLDGDTGAPITQITMGSSVGYGGAHVAAPGDPVYVEDDYVEEDYQMRENEVILLDTTDVSYTVPLVDPADDGVDFVSGLTPQKIIKSFSVANNADAQKVAILGAPNDEWGYGDQAAVSEVLQNHPTQFSMELIDLKKGPFLWDVPVVVSTIKLPKQIDLEAPSEVS
jgi:hypothetical protein